MVHLEHAPIGPEGSNEAPLVELLEVLNEATGQEFDPILAQTALAKAERMHPGATEETWRVRITRAGKDLGLRVSYWTGSLHRASSVVTRQGPLVARALSDERRWYALLESKGNRFCVLDPTEGVERWVTPGEAARLLGLATDDQAVDWILCSPLLPCADLEAKSHDAAHTPEGHAHVSPLRRLIGLLRAERRDVRTVILFAIGIGVLSLATPIAVEALVTNVAFGGAFLQPVLMLTLVLFAFLSVAAAIRTLKNYVVEVLQQRIFIRVVSDLAQRLPRVRVSAFDGDHGPEMVNRFFEVVTVQKAGSTLLLDGLSVCLQMTIGLIVLALYHPLLLGFDILLLLALGFILFGLGRGGIRSSIEESKAKYAMAGWLEEIARHPLAFKLSGGPEYALARADQLARVYLNERREHFRVLFRQIIGSLALQVFAFVGLLGLGGFLVIQQQLTLGQLVAAELIVALVLGSMTKLGKSLESFYDLATAMDKLGHLVDLPMERQDGEALPTNGRGASLRLHAVTFGYPDHGQVLRGLSASVMPGERVALVGPNGSGKSTLADLLFGLREPSEGHLEIEGTDVRELDLATLRQQVATVRNLEVFSGTVLENIRMGRAEVSLADARAALEAVDLLQDVLALPRGIHTVLTTGGAPLSDGQARRLMLARAIAGKPRLLVLDEALDDLDAQSRRKIHDTLFDRAAPWTLLVVTHDDEVRRRCDREITLPKITA